MWMNKSSVCLVAGTNNSTADPSVYKAPPRPQVLYAYTPKYLTEPALEHRNAFHSTSDSYVQLCFRVRCMNYEQVLWQLIATGSIEKDHAYDSENLPFWTVGMRVKVRTQLSMGRVMGAICSRLGAKCPGIRFCLDGFFGMRGFSDIFNNPDTCPWMEISNFSTVLSLRLKSGDNVFISVATPTQISDVVEWRRKKMINTEPQPATADSGPSKEDVNHSDVIGTISYDNNDVDYLL